MSDKIASVVYMKKDETINHIIHEYSKIAQKSTRLDMTGWEERFTGNCARD